MFGIDDNNPTGALGKLRKLRESDKIGTKDNGDSGSPWGRLWEARKEYEFRMKAGTTTPLILLSDIKMVPGHMVITGYKNFAQKSMVPSTKYYIDDNGDLQVKDSPDIFGKILGLRPDLFIVASVLDPTTSRSRTTRTDRSGVVRPIIIKSELVQQQLVGVQANDNQSLEMALFRVSRSNSDKSPNTGDLWAFQRHVTLDEIRGQEQFANFELNDDNRIDLDEAFPMVSEEDAAAIMRVHSRVYDNNRESLQKNGRYDEVYLKHALEGNWAAFGEGDSPDAPAAAPVISQEMTGSDPFDDLDAELSS